jgi:hypothetical protein
LRAAAARNGTPTAARRLPWLELLDSMRAAAAQASAI